MKNTQRGSVGIIVIVLVALVAIGGGVYIYTQKQTPNAPVSEKLLSDEKTNIVQKDEIVYVHRDGGYQSLYTISADGSNKRLVYRNTDSVNANIVNPKWSEDDTIQFMAMKNGVWKIFSIKSDGTALKIVDADVSNFILSQESRDKDLIVEYKTKPARLIEMYRIDGDKKIKIYTATCGEDCTAGWLYGLIMEASFSPDKKHVMFSSRENIVIINSDGTGKRVLTEGDEPDWH